MNRVIISALSIAFATITSAAVAGDVRGTYRDRDVLASGQGVTYNLVLEENETTFIGVNGDGDGDIDCGLFDGNGNLVDRDGSSKDGCTLTVNPKWTGKFTLKLINAGDIASVYTLLVI